MVGLLYAGVCYLLGMCAAAAFALFVLLLPAGEASLPPAAALSVDAGLLLLFGLQHSVMARPAFKHWLGRLVPPALERSTYLLATAPIVALLVFGWRHWPQPLWSIDAPLAWLLRTLQVGGVLLAVGATFQFDHLRFFGLKPAWERWRGAALPADEFRTPWLYRQVRHPMMTGFLLLLWCTPQMTADHLLLSVGMTLYILVGVHYEERDLRRSLGAAYDDYARRVPALLPRPWRPG